MAKSCRQQQQQFHNFYHASLSRFYFSCNHRVCVICQAQKKLKWNTEKHIYLYAESEQNRFSLSYMKPQIYFFSSFLFIFSLKLISHVLCCRRRRSYWMSHWFKTKLVINTNTHSTSKSTSNKVFCFWSINFPEKYQEKFEIPLKRSWPTTTNSSTSYNMSDVFF